MVRRVPVLWGIHNDQPSLDLLEGGFISIGWDELGDLTILPRDRDALKLRLAAAYPDAKPRAIAVWAGVLSRFTDEILIGDYVISPNKLERTLNFGEVTSDFYVEPASTVHRNRRRVKWLSTAISRDTFSAFN